jgi:hypothetical protein
MTKVKVNTSSSSLANLRRNEGLPKGFESSGSCKPTNVSYVWTDDPRGES